MTSIARCRFATGQARLAHLHTLEPVRQGGLREDGDYDVLCGNVAMWMVEQPDTESITVCDRDLPYVIERQAVVTRLLH